MEEILINSDTKQAYGVVFNKFGTRKTVYTDREVILSAGSLVSPQLLMLAGIGPKKHLEEVGIKLLVDSPGVGQNLQVGAIYVTVPTQISTKVLLAITCISCRSQTISFNKTFFDTKAES